MDKNKKWTILVADDEADTRRAISNMLEMAGFAVKQADDGIEALEAIAINKPDIIILDGMMPGMNGFEVYKALRENPHAKNIPIIFCSAAGEEEIQKNNIDPDSYMQKPILPQKLYQKVIKILGTYE